MSEPERLKQLLKEAKDDMDKLDDWMKSQEPAPGVSYEDWGKQETEKNVAQSRALSDFAGGSAD